MRWIRFSVIIFFFNDTATTEIYTLSLHDALPILVFMLWESTMATEASGFLPTLFLSAARRIAKARCQRPLRRSRSEEHTSELQSRQYLVCRLLLEKKNYHTSYSCCYLLSRTHLLS